MADFFKENIGNPKERGVPLFLQSVQYKIKIGILKSPRENFQTFSETSKKLESYSDFEPTIFGRVVKTAIYMSRGIFCYKQIFFFEKMIYLWTFSDIYRTIFGLWTKNFWQGFQNCIPFVQGNVVGEKNLEKIMKWLILSTLSEKFTDFQRKLIVGIVETGFYESIGTFWDFKRIWSCSL